MSQDIREFVTSSGELLAFGEAAHREPGHALVRNELLVQLVDSGFRSIALETDRVAALAVDDFVRGGAGTLDGVLRDGFSHGFGEFDANRQLVAWMRGYNADRPADEQVAFHGFDAAMETTSAPSPLRYLEFVREYLGIELDLAELAGDDERWSRPEAVMDPAMSVGTTAGAQRLRSIADDMLTTLYVRAPELVAATSRAAWYRAATHATAGLGLLRYHARAAQPGEPGTRWTALCATRDALMAQNLLDIRRVEAGRGPTLVFAHNLHLQRNLSTMRMGSMELEWFSAGAIVASLLGERYVFVAGSLGRSDALGLPEPDPGTYEGALQRGTDGWGLTVPSAVTALGTRTDTTPQQGYFPLDQAILDGADAVLHLSGR